MFDIQKARESAVGKFRIALQEKARFIAEDVWVQNVPAYLRHLNSIILAGRSLGATSMDVIADEVLESMEPMLKDFRQLEMKEEAMAYVLDILLLSGASFEELGIKNANADQ